MKDQIDFLIELLFDAKASLTERDEAATELGEFFDPRVINALTLKSRDLKENELILNSCGESLGSIWVNQNLFNKEIFQTLSGTARHGIYFVVKSAKSEWVKKYKLNEEKFSD
ncbi:MAG: hypothetical protein K1000chlam3_00896 [Chlamydiae bacterium]|nr:hypothetical protein [Chlamydiota bacterium]